MATASSTTESNFLNKEEKLNTISHGLGALLAVVGLFLLLSKDQHKTEFSTISIIVYSATLVAMMAVSAIYHASKSPRLRNRLRILDHVNIFFLIAGTYTPVTLITLVNSDGWTIFYVVWAIAIIGILFKIYYTGKYEFLSLLMYLAMGWLIVIDFATLLITFLVGAFDYYFWVGLFTPWESYFMSGIEYLITTLSGIFLFWAAR